MEQIAIISDIHGNITALNTVIADIKKRGINRIFCLGDLVYKCVNPDLVIDTVMKECEVVIKGNCDETICTQPNGNKRYWSRNKIGDERVEILKKLPVFYEFYMSGHLVRLFHASPFSLSGVYNPMYDNKDTKYLESRIDDAELLFENTEFLGKTKDDLVPDIIGYGHLHTPNLFRIKNKTVFNTGSVGIPIEMLNTNNDINTSKFSTLSSYIILEGVYNSKELAEISFNLVRLPYDIEKEIEYLEKSDISKKENIINSLKNAKE